MKTIRSISVSVTVLILLIGVALPIFSTVQDERIYLAYTKLMETDIMGAQSPQIILDASNEPFEYLMKHPQKTLKRCLNYEAENPEDSKLLLNTTLGVMAYQKINDSKFSINGYSLNETIKKEDPKLYEQLMEK